MTTKFKTQSTSFMSTLPPARWGRKIGESIGKYKQKHAPTQEPEPEVITTPGEVDDSYQTPVVDPHHY